MAPIIPPEERPIVTRKEATAAGAKCFFTGRPCKAGHVSERYLSTGDCLTCVQARSAIRYSNNRERLCAEQCARQAANPERKRAYNKVYHAEHRAENRSRNAVWRAANRDEYRASQAAWRAAHPERQRELNVAYYAGNRETLLLANQEYRAANHEKLLAKKAADYAADPEPFRARNRAYQKAHPEPYKAARATRRARKRKAGVTHSGKDIKALFKLQRGKCAHPWCRLSLASGYHVDHIVPLARGGSNDRRNLQLLCAPCNMKKGRKHPIDFARSRGFLV